MSVTPERLAIASLDHWPDAWSHWPQGLRIWALQQRDQLMADGRSDEWVARAASWVDRQITRGGDPVPAETQWQSFESHMEKGRQSLSPADVEFLQGAVSHSGYAMPEGGSTTTNIVPQDAYERMLLARDAERSGDEAAFRAAVGKPEAWHPELGRLDAVERQMLAGQGGGAPADGGDGYGGGDE